MYLEKINGPEDVKKIEIDKLPVLAQEIRDALLVRASKHGGHFGPNFGMVEATIALHYVFESPKDKIVYDVSHQSYPHKMLTGRKEAYLSEQHYDDVSGYTNPNESEHDFFTVGHTSTSVSLAAGRLLKIMEVSIRILLCFERLTVRQNAICLRLWDLTMCMWTGATMLQLLLRHLKRSRTALNRL